MESGGEASKRECSKGFDIGVGLQLCDLEEVFRENTFAVYCIASGNRDFSMVCYFS